MKSAAVTPVTGESNVAVTAMLESGVVVGPLLEVKVALGGVSAKQRGAAATRVRGNSSRSSASKVAGTHKQA